MVQGLSIVRTRLVPLVIAAVLSAWAPPALSQDRAKGKIDFDREVRPIFLKHCFKCHGPVKHSGMLRLDRKKFAAMGGESGKPILGGDENTNEILRRVTTDDIDDLMPKEGERLDEQEVAVIRRWVQAGTPWIDEEGEIIVPWWLKATETFSWYYDRHFRPVAIYLMVFLLFTLLCERCKVMVGRDSLWAQRRLERLIWWLNCIPRSWYVLGVMTIFLAQSYLQTSQMRRELAIAQAKPPVTLAGQTVGGIYGSPPIPFRPDQPRRLGGEYYRGNCERSEKLFNGGNYLTATLRLSLHGPDREPIKLGDPVPSGGLQLRFEVERAPGTSDSLFTEKIMTQTFLSPEVYSGSLVEPIDSPTWLTAEEPGKRWVGWITIPKVGAVKEGDLSGTVYVYRGRREGMEISGEAHYGLKYDLKITDGRIAEGSDMWVGSIFWHGGIALPADPSKVPFEQWFSVNPLPIITGPNSQDPKLLGITSDSEGGKSEPADPPQSPQDQP